MVVLKKIKATTLSETLVATVLIMVIFMISSLILNNLFTNTIKNNTRDINTYLNELKYLYLNNKLKTPYKGDFNDWQISTISYKENEINKILLEAVNSKTKKNLVKSLNEN